LICLEDNSHGQIINQFLLWKKLDRFLVSREWELLFPLTTVHKLSREISDHNPIILDTMEGREKQSSDFIFDKRWLKDESFHPKVARVWAQPVRARDSLSDKGIVNS
jgi:hypothetical protein